MSEFSGAEIYGPGEGQGAALEGLSEAAKQRFAAAAALMRQLRKEEKQAKKKDDQVARTIIQFLQNPAHTRFFVLISKIVARNCPSIFVLGLLSLINEECLKMVEEYFSEQREPGSHETVEETLQLFEGKVLEMHVQRPLLDWITRLQMILAHDPERIIGSLLIDSSTAVGAGRHIDGAVVQLTIFILQEFFEREEGKEPPYEKAQPLTASILQTVFEPFMGAVQKRMIKEQKEP